MSESNSARLQASREWMRARQAQLPGTQPSAFVLPSTEADSSAAARWRLFQQDLEPAPAAPEPTPEPPEVATPVRQRERAADWHSRAYMRHAELRSRYAGHTEQVDQALADELARGPDFARCHRGSMFMDPPKNNLDQNFRKRVMDVAETVERKTWHCKKKGKHGGTLGKAALRVLRVLLFVIKKIGGKLFPSLETLTGFCQMSKQTVVTALDQLELFGFVTVHKRIKRIQTPFGVRVVQDSNAYEYHLPKTGLGALAMAVFCGRPSESKNSDAKSTSSEVPSTDRESSSSNLGETDKGLAGKEADRWWLHEPFQTGNGGWR